MPPKQCVNNYSERSNCHTGEATVILSVLCVILSEAEEPTSDRQQRPVPRPPDPSVLLRRPSPNRLTGEANVSLSVLCVILRACEQIPRNRLIETGFKLKLRLKTAGFAIKSQALSEVEESTSDRQ